jgi:RHH-type transcriptional regulator, proline utilization regulon repressor / proline dehydrogenase / delta 1-pyrroline-5-carboxylate dehydrogenase
MTDHFAPLSALYTADEHLLTKALVKATCFDDSQRAKIEERAGHWVEKVRANTRRVGMIDAFLQEYGLSTQEGVILMRLSEALIRTPDFATAQELMRDKLVAGAWDSHSGSSPTSIVNAATAGLRLSAAWISATGGNGAARLAAKLGDRVLHAAVVRGMGIMARHFVLGRSIEDAVERANRSDKQNALYSFDMLGEGATTLGDAQRYFEAYVGAVRHLAGSVGKAASVATSHGLSVKLSALYPRYEYAKRAACVPALVEKVTALALIAKQAGVGLTIDAEEADRLELSLQIFTALLNDPKLGDWDGLGIVIQAYQRRATATIDYVLGAVGAADRGIAVRLVKGAYWDAEIKRAQEMGLESYPVFTRKEHTDISYLACAAKLLAAGPCIFPQFATHNAHSAAAIIDMAGANTRFEFQRLHGMGEALHDEITTATGISSRVYAPVGSHKELLPYLVRRLLENGANSSFVNQLMNPDIEVDDIVRDPINTAQEHAFSAHPAIPAPRDIFGGTRLGALGLDLTQSTSALAAETLLVGQPATHPIEGMTVETSTPGDIDRAIASARNSTWLTHFTPHMRATCLMKAASLMEERMPELMVLCVREAGKTLPDAVAEIREAVDFCRYYAAQATAPAMATQLPLGIVACISPWNFPLAIFIGQVAAALVAGNCVVAKPAVQTPLIALAGVNILYEAGVPRDALHFVSGGGDIGAALVGHGDVDGVCFTGSTPTAQRIVLARAAIGRGDSVLIAETGGINAMMIDSTALLEQAVGDVVASAFQSAGQRCSACRLVCVQDDIADDFEAMLAGAIALLQVGDPALLATDVGPIIDADAQIKIANYVKDARTKFKVIGEAREPLGLVNGHFIAPIALGINTIKDLQAEIFGPVLHVVRFASADTMSVVEQINALGFGLTLGVHSRIDSRIKAIVTKAKVGNIYVNRNQIGAVVGVQPFGGEGLSGTGPKAGGPHYLLRLSRRSDAPLSLADEGAAQLAPQVSDVSAHLGSKLVSALQAQTLWAQANKIVLVNDIARELGDEDFVSGDIAKSLVALTDKVALPGPTGEENSLRLVPRGVLLCCGGNSPSALVRQTLIALAAGCGVLLIRSPDAQRIEEVAHIALKAAGNSVSLLTMIDAQALGAALHSHIQGVVADGQVRDGLAQYLATRTGAIIPLLSSSDDPYRFFHERTLTIDTTAAGGNASLLAMQSHPLTV